MSSAGDGAGPRLRRLIRYQGLRIILSPLGFLPRPWGRALGAFYGRLAWSCLPDLRRRSLRHLARAFPEWSKVERWRVASEVPSWIGRTGADFLRLGGGGQVRLLAAVEVDGFEHWQTASAMGPGVVAVTGHLGNWEVLGAWLATLGRPVRVLYHPVAEERLNDLVCRRRERAGIRLLAANRAGLPGLRALGRGEVVGVLMDRVPRGPSVACRFFGHECRTAPGAAWLAVHSGAPILPVALWHERGGRYRVRFEPPLSAEAEGVSKKDGVVRLTRRVTAILEEQIRRCPDQWPWFYDRWKIRPGPLLEGGESGEEEPGSEVRDLDRMD